MKSLLDRRAFGLGSLLAVLLIAVVAAPAQAATSTPIDTSDCSPPALSQPFLSVGDSNWYTLAPGESANNFDGTGWVLSGGAQIVTTQFADGTLHSVLDLPSGARAVSPTMCITSAYPVARTMVRDLVGSEGVFTYVSYMGTSTWTTPQNTGQFHGNAKAWTLSGNINVHPGSASGWQKVRFTLIGGGKTSDFQVYGFWVDPRCHG
jgi:hypothetical protein